MRTLHPFCVEATAIDGVVVPKLLALFTSESQLVIDIFNISVFHLFAPIQCPLRVYQYEKLLTERIRVTYIRKFVDLYIIYTPTDSLISD